MHIADKGGKKKEATMSHGPHMHREGNKSRKSPLAACYHQLRFGLESERNCFQEHLHPVGVKEITECCLVAQ